MKKKLIYLADLTHKGLILSSNVFPLSIGLIGSYLIKHRKEKVKIELFKYPEDLNDALEKKIPDLVGFANYSWNFDISSEFAKNIKIRNKKTIIVFGGPNYDLTENEMKEFWKTNDFIDFYIAQEGEQAFLNLFDKLEQFKFNINDLKSKSVLIGNTHYKDKSGSIVKGDVLPRINIEELPSPYLMGLMDKFFDNKLIPMIHTTRGCPFSCAFCSEGTSYYNKVFQRNENLENELKYISKKTKKIKNLFISDANFGMYKQDLDKARIISMCQKKYNYPKYIHVSTGKNQKERVISIAKLLNGAINLAASLQSTDENVLKNIDRSNISIEKLSEIGKKANSKNTGTYSEIILGLPGDTKKTHFKTLKDAVESGFDNIRMFQLIMIPQTKLNTFKNRQDYKMKTKYRIMPRSYGVYDVFNKKVISVESEEILISSSTMSFEEYLECREMNLTVEILHNGKIFLELQGLCKAFNISWFDLIYQFFKKRRQNKYIKKLYNDFKNETSQKLWDNKSSLKNFVTKNVDSVLNDEKGANELSLSKATAFFKIYPEINKTFFSIAKQYFFDSSINDKLLEKYLNELEKYSLLRKSDIFINNDFENNFYFDFKKIEKFNFDIKPNKFYKNKKINFSISHNNSQKKLINSFNNEFGNTFDGLGKMLMRYPHVHRLFRKPKILAN